MTDELDPLANETNNTMLIGYMLGVAVTGIFFSVFGLWGILSAAFVGLVIWFLIRTGLL